jgi:hypothetical protein
MTQYTHYYLKSENLAIIAMIMVASLDVGTVALNYDLAFAKPVRAHSPCEKLVVFEHNPNCQRR